MNIKTYTKAALLGAVVTLASLGASFEASAQSGTVRIVKRGTASSLDVPINRAIVVESDVPFAELSIANPSIADISSLSDRTIYVLGKAPGLTTLTLLDAGGRLITNVDVRVAADITEFKERLRQILPGEKIEVRTANDGIVLSGVVSSASRLQRALDLAERYASGRVSNLMVVGGIQQVMLKVRFAEMNRSVSKSLSSSLVLDKATGGRTLRGGTGAGITNEAVTSLTGNVLPSSSENNGALLFGFSSGALRLGILLEALEQKGMVRTLAEPNLVALSGQAASFLAGGEYPVPVSQESGVVSVEFRPFGVELNFTPRVVDADIINLDLQASVSSIDTANGYSVNGFQIDAFTKRETSTTVELRDGESFAIAGLLQDNFVDNASQLPWVGDIPVLGALFRSADYRRSQTELVIIITAHLVSPTRGEALALPTDRVVPPTERNLFLHGQTSIGTSTPTTGAAGEVARQDFSGSYGYVLE
jgi:pilus assembly protein CpaC